MCNANYFVTLLLCKLCYLVWFSQSKMAIFPDFFEIFFVLRDLINRSDMYRCVTYHSVGVYIDAV